MSHPRIKILKTVRDIIKNGKTLAGDKIYINKMIHPDDTCLPQVIIYTNIESIAEFDQSPRVQKRKLAMNIDVLMQRPTENEDYELLEQLVWQIEVLLADDDTWNGSVSHNYLKGERFQFRETGSVPISHCEINYEAEYFTTLPDNIGTQKTANLTNLDGIDGLVNPDPDKQSYGWDLQGIAGSPAGVIEAELLIDTSE